ncbi:MAG: hypothetical protein IT330_14675 [Anaerolineae bacterium]|nr:hypothetical protein [Anaerolineae bacterium]
MTPPSIAFRLEEPSGLRREKWPVTRGVPFPQGALRSYDHLRLLDERGQELPSQVKPLGAPWPDGSVRWALLHFQADLEPQSIARFQLEYGSGVQRSPVSPGVTVTRESGHFTFDTGPLRATFSLGKGFPAIEQAWLDGKTMLSPAEPAGFILEDAHGQVFSSAWGEVSAVTVEEEGPLRAVVHVKGDHRSEKGERLFGYEARLYAYAGQPWLEVEYTFINDADEQFTDLNQIGFQVHPQVGTGRKGLCGAYRDLYESADPFSIYGDAASSSGVFAGLRIYDAQGNHVEVAYPGELSHKVAHGWLDLSDERGGLTVAVKRAVQLYPKQIVFTGDTIRVDLWPSEAGPLHWHQGMARTHRVLFHFHHGSGQEAEVNKLSTCYEQDPLLWAPGWYVESGVMGPLLPHQPRRYPHIEIALREQFTLWHYGNRATGFLDYGDCPQVGGAWEQFRYMANNQADLIHALALQYARVGEEWYYEDLEAAAWHLMDVDTIHHTTFDPVERGGARMQGTGHVQYNCEGLVNVSVASSQMWIEGLLEYYYLSGHPRALAVARGIGDCFLRMLDRGWGLYPYPVSWHGSRDSGWPLIALTALYEATREEKWLDGCRRIAENLLANQGEDGAWDMWWGDWQRILSPLHLGITLTALCRYHQMTGDERVKRSLVRAADAMLTECAHPDGALMYVTRPGYRWNYYLGSAIESLGYVWQLTGNQRYLQDGWLAHRQNFANSRSPSLTGAVLAYSWRGNLRYMYWADRAGLLTDLSV